MTNNSRFCFEVAVSIFFSCLKGKNIKGSKSKLAAKIYGFIVTVGNNT